MTKNVGVSEGISSPLTLVNMLYLLKEQGCTVDLENFSARDLDILYLLAVAEQPGTAKARWARDVLCTATPEELDHMVSRAESVLRRFHQCIDQLCGAAPCFNIGLIYHKDIVPWSIVIAEDEERREPVLALRVYKDLVEKMKGSMLIKRVEEVTLNTSPKCNSAIFFRYDLSNTHQLIQFIMDVLRDGARRAKDIIAALRAPLEPPLLELCSRACIASLHQEGAK